MNRNIFNLLIVVAFIFLVMFLAVITMIMSLAKPAEAAPVDVGGAVWWFTEEWVNYPHPVDVYLVDSDGYAIAQTRSARPDGTYRFVGDFPNAVAAIACGPTVLDRYVYGERHFQTPSLGVNIHIEKLIDQPVCPTPNPNPMPEPTPEPPVADPYTIYVPQVYTPLKPEWLPGEVE